MDRIDPYGRHRVSAAMSPSPDTWRSAAIRQLAAQYAVGETFRFLARQCASSVQLKLSRAAAIVRPMDIGNVPNRVSPSTDIAI
jgi:hypothetical protein